MLYNEFRPNSFSMVKGQNENKQILTNQLIEGKPSHSYIFHGLHGSGKTTCARIFAKSLNCENPHNGEPCNECSSCREFNTSTNADIFEIDAASNNKVEDVSKIKDLILYPPQRKYKIFILDEAHMLSKAAWNSLLTTIEEAPERVIFIFCSTELNKFPTTIVSRCMTLTFSNIATKEIVDNLEYIAKSKQFEYDLEGLKLIANISNGSMRDALSNMEKCIAYGYLNASNVADTLGLVDQGNVFSIIKSMVTNDIENMLSKIEELSNMGKDIYELTKEILEGLRDINVYSLTKNSTIVNKDTKYLSAFNVDKFQVSSAVNKFYSLLNSIKNSDNKKVLLDITMIEVSTLFVNAIVNDFETTIDIKESKNEKIIVPNNVIQSDNVSNDTAEKHTENSDEEVIDYYSLLPKKVDLLNSYDVKDEQLRILLFSKIFTKNNAFVIKGKEVDLLNKEEVKEKLCKLCNKKINLLFIKE